ncbi:hypothetical protein ACFXJ5_11980 [Streptomyces sp. NPDC059373]
MITIVVPALVVLGGVALVVRTAVPHGRLAGPLALACLGLAALLLRFSDSSYIVAVEQKSPTVLIAGGFIMALFRRRPVASIDTGVRRFTSVAYPHVNETFAEPNTTPRKVIVRALLGGSVRVDLARASYPFVDARMVVDVTVLGGQVELVVPEEWQVMAGRVDLTYGVRFEGRLSTAELAPLLPRPEEADRRTVVINVVGSGGSVTVIRG